VKVIRAERIGDWGLGIEDQGWCSDLDVESERRWVSFAMWGPPVFFLLWDVRGGVLLFACNFQMASPRASFLYFYRSRTVVSIIKQALVERELSCFCSVCVYEKSSRVLEFGEDHRKEH
jgi:hypothetical protein